MSIYDDEPGLDDDELLLADADEDDDLFALDDAEDFSDEDE